MSDVAFLVMDLHQRERPDFARRCLNRWLERSGDYEGLAVLHYYLVYRALVRAKVAAIRATQGGAQAANAASESQALLDLGERFARTGAPQLLITQGVSGSGKTTVTSTLLELANLIRIRSDVERKRLFALSSEARSGSNVDAGIYARDATQRTYARLLALSQGILRAGHSVVVDATFLDRSDRDAFRARAVANGAGFRILACRAHRETLRERVVMREQHERDASEAGLPVLARQLEQGVELGDDELQEATLIDTSSPIDTRALANALGLLR
jgi:predicted kinase